MLFVADQKGNRTQNDISSSPSHQFRVDDSRNAIKKEDEKLETVIEREREKGDKLVCFHNQIELFSVRFTRPCRVWMANTGIECSRSSSRSLSSSLQPDAVECNNYVSWTKQLHNEVEENQDKVDKTIWVVAQTSAGETNSLKWAIRRSQFNVGQSIYTNLDLIFGSVSI